MTHPMRLASLGGATTTYVDDVFSTYLYTGNGSTQTITNGIDLAGKGGMVWFKSRSTTTYGHLLFDTNRGNNVSLATNSTAANNAGFSSFFNFLSNGFSLGNIADMNTNAEPYVSWTFRKAPKFFDVVTYTGDGTNRAISHSLGQAPGTIIVKRTNTTSAWWVYHRSLGATKYLALNTTAAESAGDFWNNQEPTASVFYVGASAGSNSTGDTYVAYLFAHGTAADGLIQCGSYTGNGNTTVGVGQQIILGWEPQFVLIKKSSAAGSWKMFDTMRGFSMAGGDAELVANGSTAENPSSDCYPYASGFGVDGTGSNNLNDTYIYVAIRRPNKPPTVGIVGSGVYVGDNTNNRLITTGLVTDMAMFRMRTGSGTGYEGFVVGDRLRGQPWLKTGATQAETTTANGLDQQLVSATEYGTAFSSMTGVWVGNNSGTAASNTNLNGSSTSQLVYAFKRAPGAFDVVCYTGTGSNTTITHNLGAVPELMMIKSRSGTTAWAVYAAELANTEYLVLDTTAAKASGATYWNSTTPTSTVFSIGTAAAVNTNTATYVAYLFATVAGVSKVGSYTGNGTSQTINCGFSTGANIVLIKRIDNTGDWYVWDVTRGIVASNDPHLSLNGTAAEVGTDDSVDADNSGFIVNQVAATNVNVNTATYIYMAFS